jgi:hypothetical protein
MKKLIFFLVSLLILGLIFLFFTTKEKQLPSPLIVEGFSKNNERMIKGAFEKWTKKHGRSRNIKVVTFHGVVEYLPNGVIDTTKEVSSPGLIKIDPEKVNESNNYKNEMFNIVLHSMTHASVEKTNTPSRPIPFSQGLMISFQGASIEVELKDGTRNFWRLLEEAICERNAAMLGNYDVEHIDYFKLGKLAMKHFPNGVDTMRYVRKSNVPGLVGIILKKDPSTVTVQDIEKVMQIYEGAVKQ